MKFTSFALVLSLAASLAARADSYAPNPKSAFDELGEMFSQAAPASSRDFLGTFEAKCFSREYPDTPFTTGIQGKYEIQTSNYDNGPLLPPTRNSVSIFKVGFVARDSSYINDEVFNFAELKKAGAYLFLRIPGETRWEAPHMCYAFRK